jgi:hypothetical protein
VTVSPASADAVSAASDVARKNLAPPFLMSKSPLQMPSRLKGAADSGQSAGGKYLIHNG